MAEQKQQQKRQSSEEGKDLNSLHLSQESEDVDVSKLSNALTHLQKERDEIDIARKARDRQLAQISVAAEDIAFLGSEFEMDREVAISVLRNHGGDLKTTVEALVCT